MTSPAERALAERFEIRRELGRGGFAVVYEATERRTGQVVALKVLLHDADGAYDRQTRARFQREVKILNQLESPHTVRLLDHGEVEGHLFAVFELVGGEDLSAFLKRRGSLTPEEAVSVLRQVLRALAEAHRLGLVHRDLKPENIRVIREGNRLTTKVLDFGIARRVGVSAGITRSGELVGTPRYMSPEQLKDQPLSPASDIYSLGMIAYELLLGRDALPGNRWADQLDRLRTGHLFSAPQLEHVGPFLAIIQRMTATRPESRFTSAQAVLVALDGPLEGPAPESVVEAKPRPWGLMVAAIFTVVLIGIAAIVMSSTDGPPPVEPVPELPPGVTAINESAPSEGTKAVADVGRDTAIDGSELPESTYAMRADAVPSAGCGKEPLPTKARYHLPDRYQQDVPTPLVILLHSDNNSPEALLASSGLVEVANREGFVIVAPNGRMVPLEYAHAWRDSETEEAIRHAHEQALEFFCIDETRVFLVATGDGGRKVHRLYGDPWVRAVAVNSYLENHKWGRPSRNVPALWILPNASEHIRLDGRPNCSGKPKVTLEQLMLTWRSNNGCKPEPQRTEALGECLVFDCRTPFEVCIVPGGEGWVPSTYPDQCDDPPPAPVPRAERIWDFLISSPPRTL